MFKANLLKSWAMPLKKVLLISYQLFINSEQYREVITRWFLVGTAINSPKTIHTFLCDRLGEFKVMIPSLYCNASTDYELSASQLTSCAWLVSRCCSCRLRTELLKLFVVFVAEGRLQCIIIVTITHGVIKLMSTRCAK